MAKLINGNGNPAVYAAEDADMLAGIMGNVTTITAVGNEFAATASGANLIEVADGVILTQEGRRIQLDAGLTDAFTIPSGTAGTTNYYIIGYRLYESASGTQECETFVQLMASASDTIPEATFRGGATEVFVSLYRVEQDGINLGTITLLLPKVSGICQINSDLSEKVTKFSGTDSGNTYVTVDQLAYDRTHKKLGLKVNGADTVIPFSSGYDWNYIGTGNGSNQLTFNVGISTPYIILFRYKISDGSIIYWFGTSESSFARTTRGSQIRDMVVTSITGSLSRSGNTWTVNGSYGPTYAVAIPMFE